MSLIIARVFGNVNIINVNLSMKSMKLSKNKGYTIFVDAAEFSSISLIGGDFSSISLIGGDFSSISLMGGDFSSISLMGGVFSLMAMFFCRQVLAAVVY